MKTCILAAIASLTLASPLAAQDGEYSTELVGSVYFEYNSSVLTESAKELVTVFVASVGADQDTVFVLEGHTDTALASPDSLILSAKMANAVAAHMMKIGVAEDRIKLLASGESVLARATADGVREPINRRVEISIVAK